MSMTVLGSFPLSTASLAKLRRRSWNSTAGNITALPFRSRTGCPCLSSFGRENPAAMQADAVAWAEREARWHGVAAVITDLAHLVAQLALVEGVKDADALEDAERLSDMADAVTTDGRVADTPADPDVDGAFLGWHALGSVHLEAIACTVCGACYETDDEAAEIPACHDCGAPDTWENRQGVSFRALVAEIDGSASLAELARLGERRAAVDLRDE